MARLAKIMRYHPKFSLGMLRRSDGNMANSPEESLEILTSTSFPGSMEIENPEPLEAGPKFKPISAPWRSLERIKMALGSFAPFKASGIDGIKPHALQHLPDNFLNNLKNIYDASITCGYTPLAWRESKVIYIPKMGKSTYDEAKSFRPITLTSYLFKGLEKLVYWHVEAQKNPI